MKHFFLQELLKPMVHRVGTVVGTYLASVDLFTHAQVDILSQGAVILAGVGLDLVTRRVL